MMHDGRLRPEPVLRAERLCKVYRRGETPVAALRDVDLVISAGEFVAITGPSGSGKSTLMNMLGCLDVPTSGNLYVDGTSTASLTTSGLASFRGRTVGFVFQSFNLLPRLTAVENVALPLLYREEGRGDRLQRARLALDRVGLGERMEHLPRQLSGGQQQRVAIARALVGDPRLILADEPSGALDSESAGEILAVLESLNGEGVTVIVVTHDASVAARARRLVNLKDGRVLFDGPQPEAKTTAYPSSC